MTRRQPSCQVGSSCGQRSRQQGLLSLILCLRIFEPMPLWSGSNINTFFFLLLFCRIQELGPYRLLSINLHI